MNLPISVIIPTMNRPVSLNKTIQSIAKANDVPQQIIVVDQSQDLEVRNKNENILNQYDCINSKTYVYQPTPSLTKARNIGLTKARNDIIIFSDDDVDMPVDVFTNVVRLMQDHKVAMIAGIDDLSKQSHSNIGYFLGTKSFFNRHIGHVTWSMLGRYPDNITTKIETQWAQGFFFVVRKSCLDRWQIRFDEHLTNYAYAEDLDFSYTYYKAAKEEGLQCILDPHVHVKHLATFEDRIPTAKSTYMYILNRKYLAHKHHMGFKGIISRNWCELWRLVEYIIERKDVRVFWHAYLCKFKYGNEINSGVLDYNKYMK